jgi:hypothetical protein
MRGLYEGCIAFPIALTVAASTSLSIYNKMDSALLFYHEAVVCVLSDKK